MKTIGYIVVNSLFVMTLPILFFASIFTDPVLRNAYYNDWFWKLRT